MMITIRQRLQSEDGISLVEMLIAVMMLGVVFMASTSTMIASFTSIGSAEARTRANALANEQLEDLRGMRWVDVGYRSLVSGGAADLPPAGVTDPVEGTASSPDSVETITRGGVDFTVTRIIEWVSHPNTPVGSQDYKRLRIEVDWLDRGVTPRDLAVETFRAPSPDEGHDPAPFVLSLFDVQPQVVHLNADGTIATGQNILMTARTSSAAQFVTVSFRQLNAGSDTTLNLTNIEDGIGWSRTTSGISMANGEALFQFEAKRLDPYVETVFGEKIVRFLLPHAFRTVTVSPYDGAFCLPPGAETPPLTVDVDVDGMVDEDEVLIEWPGGSVEASVVSYSTTGTAFTAQVPAGTYADDATLTITATRLGNSSMVTTRQVNVVRSEGC